MKPKTIITLIPTILLVISTCIGVYLRNETYTALHIGFCVGIMIMLPWSLYQSMKDYHEGVDLGSYFGLRRTMIHLQFIRSVMNGHVPAEDMVKSLDAIENRIKNEIMENYSHLKG